MLLQSF